MEVTEKRILEALLSGDIKKRDWAIYQFYENTSLKKQVIQYVKNHGGSPEDGEGTFHEALLVFDRKVREEKKFDGTSALKTYFISIAKWTWVSLRRKHKKLKLVSSEEIPEKGVAEIELNLYKKEKKMILDKAIATLKERCQELLKYYKLDYSMKEIQTLMGFSNTNMAKKEAYRCRKKLRQYFLDHPDLLKALTSNDDQ